MFFVLCKYILIFMLITIVPCYFSLLINFFNEVPNFYVIPSALERNEIIAQQVMHLFFLIGLMFVHPVIYTQFRNKTFEMLEVALGPSDFTVMVNGLGENYDISQLKDFMQSWGDIMTADVEIIVPTYDIRELFQNSKQVLQWKANRVLAQQGFPRTKNRICRKKEVLKVKECNEMVESLLKKQENLREQFKNEKKGPVAFVCYQSHERARDVLEYRSLLFHQSVFQWIKFKFKGASKNVFEGKFLTFRRPSHPSDILWENLTHAQSMRIRSQIWSVMGSIFILIAAGTLLFLIRNYQKTELSTEADVTLQNIFTFVASLIPSLLILVLNLALEAFMEYITKFELHLSYTDHKISVARKLIVLMFINTALVPTIVNAYIVKEHEDWFARGGLCSDIYTIVLINAIIPPLFYFYMFNPLYQLFLWKRRKLVKQFEKGTVHIPQVEANRVFTPIDIDLAERYAQIIKTLYVGLFFTPLVPMSVPISMIGIVLEVVITKYMLLRKHPRPRIQTEELSLELAKWLRHSISIYAFGLSFFYFQIDDNQVDDYDWDHVVVLSLVFFLLGIIYLGIPINHRILRKHVKILKDRMSEKFDPEKKENQYRFKRISFETDFERENPSTNDESTRRLKADKSAVKLDPNAALPQLPDFWHFDTKKLVKCLSSYNQKKKALLRGIGAIALSGLNNNPLASSVNRILNKYTENKKESQDYLVTS